MPAIKTFLKRVVPLPARWSVRFNQDLISELSLLNKRLDNIENRFVELRNQAASPPEPVASQISRFCISCRKEQQTFLPY